MAIKYRIKYVVKYRLVAVTWQSLSGQRGKAGAAACALPCLLLWSRPRGHGSFPSLSLLLQWPPGNVDAAARAAWEGGAAGGPAGSLASADDANGAAPAAAALDRSVMSAAEAAEYEERKLKMRKVRRYGNRIELVRKLRRRRNR
jgi:hypothetical protein